MSDEITKLNMFIIKKYHLDASKNFDVSTKKLVELDCLSRFIERKDIHKGKYLFRAIKYNSKKILKFLVDNFNYSSKILESATSLAIIKGNLFFVKKYPPFEFKYYGKNNKRDIEIACENKKNYKMVKYLLTLEIPYSKEDCFLSAISSGSVKMLKLFPVSSNAESFSLKAQIPLFYRSYTEQLVLVVKSRSLEMVKHFIEDKPVQATREFWNHIDCYSMTQEIANYLLSPRITNIAYLSPLHLYCKKIIKGLKNNFYCIENVVAFFNLRNKDNQLKYIDEYSACV